MAATLVERGRLSAEHRFFAGMALAILVTVVVGFSRSFFLRPLFPDWPSPSETIFYVHGTVFTAWILLLLAQATLVASGRTDVHRKVGAFGAVLAIAMVVLGALAGLIAARRPTGFVEIPVPPLQFLAIPLFDIALFALFVTLAIAVRRNTQSHKRFMLLATINLVPAAVARWPIVIDRGPLAFFGLTDLFLVALAVWDLRTRGRLHPVTLWGGLLIIASQPLRLVILGTEGWLAFARWATGLVG
jgi:uncharacterized membrane protein YozB (DUF420 family)